MVEKQGFQKQIKKPTLNIQDVKNKNKKFKLMCGNIVT